MVESFTKSVVAVPVSTRTAPQRMQICGSLLHQSRIKVTKVTHVVMNHECKDTHHGRTSVVELNASLLALPLIRLLVPTEVESVTKVAFEFGFAGSIAHHNFQNCNRETHPKPGTCGQLLKCGPSCGDVFISWESDACAGHELSHDCQHGHAAVLKFNVAELIKDLLVSTGDIKGIPKPGPAKGLGALAALAWIAVELRAVLEAGAKAEVPATKREAATTASFMVSSVVEEVSVNTSSQEVL